MTVSNLQSYLRSNKELRRSYTARPGDVADPWYTGDFSATWRDVAEGCRGLLKAITSQAM